MESGSTENKFICSYFEPEWTASDMDEIKAHGFNTVLLCVTEQMLIDDPASAKTTARYAKDIGPETWGDLWAFGKVFGGEAASPFAKKKTPHHDDPEFQQLIKDGIDYTAALGAKAMFWDEPHFKNCQCCHGFEADFILRQADTAKSFGLENSVCLTSSTANMAVLDYLASHSQIDDIATDPYYTNYPGANKHRDDSPDAYVGKYAKHLLEIAEHHGKSSHLWVQNFDLRGGHEDLPLLAARAAIKAGMADLAVWGFRACQSIPEITPDNPDKVWQQNKQIAHLLTTS